jgi:hypothetical protein
MEQIKNPYHQKKFIHKYGGETMWSDRDRNENTFYICFDEDCGVLMSGMMVKESFLTIYDTNLEFDPELVRRSPEELIKDEFIKDYPEDDGYYLKHGYLN